MRRAYRVSQRRESEQNSFDRGARSIRADMAAAPTYSMPSPGTEGTANIT